jgi:hypothetical protein
MNGFGLPVERSREWLTLVESFTGTLEPGGPMTFVIGAGASISSNAPSTEAVELRWLDSHLFKDRESLLKGIAELGDAQKINPIRELFSRVRPFIGYQCLAALGRHRQVLVLNLNWDDALEQACGGLGVRHHLLTVSSQTTGQLIAGKRTLLSLEKGEPGIFSFHVHGRLDNPESGIRFGIYETLEFSSEVKDVIEKHYFNHPTIVVGASLAGDYDVIDLLRTLAEGSPGLPRQLSPFYIFSRQAERKGAPSDGLVQNVLFSRKSVPNFRGDPTVDFDRLLLDIATRLKGTELGRSIQGRPQIIPSLEELAIPTPAALGYHSSPCDQHALVIEGDARIGKSSAALLLSHLYDLCDEPKPTITWHSGPKPCADALRRFLVAKRTDDPNRVLVLDDPFGKTADFKENQDFVARFDRYLKIRPKTPGRAKTKTRVIVTTRASNWQKGVANSEVARSEAIRSISATDWYADAELAAYLQSKVENSPLIRREIHKRELATPAAVQEALSDTSGQRKAMIEEKVALLRALDDDTAWYVVLARLQELWPNGVADIPLHDALGVDDAFAKAALMLRKRQLDEHTYVVPAHSTDREAIDRFFAERQAELEPRLEQVERSCGPAGGACKLWSAVRALREGEMGELETLTKSVRLDWGPMFIGEAARTGPRAEAVDLVLKTLKTLRKDEQGFWSIRELVFETIRFWPLLGREKAAEEFLDEILERDDLRGRYLVLEGMLYVQAATYPDSWELSAYAEVWDKLAASRHKLLRAPHEHIEELALLYDAFTWCPPRLEPHELHRWLDPLVVAADECSPLATTMQFSSFYHPDGSAVLRSYGIKGPHTVPRNGQLSEAEAGAAAFMVRWHFVHQSRARALLYRRDMEPAHAYLVHRILSSETKTLQPEISSNCERMVQALAESDEHAGWAIHLAMGMKRLGFDPGCVATAIRNRPTGDPGLITGVMTYEIPPSLAVPLSEYFADEANNAALRAALSAPPTVEGVVVGPPPFCASRRPRQVQEILNVSCPGLIEDGVPVGDEIAFLRMLHASAFEIRRGPSAAEISSDALKQAVDMAAAGDFGALELSISLRGQASHLDLPTPQALLTGRLETLARELEAERRT